MTVGTLQLERRKNLSRALKRAKAGEEISLEMLAHLWKVTKARFVNVKAQIPDFPEPSSKDPKTGALSYPAKATLEILTAWEHRDDKVAAERNQRHRKLLGGQDEEEAPEDEVILPPSELLKYDQLSTSVQKREIDQGNLVYAADVAALAAEVFSLCSGYLGGLANAVDPNGLLDAAVRSTIDDGGRELLFKLHGEMSKLFGAGEPPPVEQPRASNEARKPSRPKGARSQNRQSKRA